MASSMEESWFDDLLHLPGVLRFEWAQTETPSLHTHFLLRLFEGENNLSTIKIIVNFTP